MVQKIVIGDGMYDVQPFENMIRNPNLIDNCTAIDIDDGYVYPIRNKTDTKPGAYTIGPYVQFVQPQENEARIYSKENIIDFSNSKDIKEVMSKQSALDNQERTILTTIDNKFVTSIDRNDSPHMAALKQAINDKGIDIDKYEHRFGPNFNNDRRLLKKNDITMNKFMTFIDKMDLAATLIIKDANPDVPNPMGHEIVVELSPSKDEGEA